MREIFRLYNAHTNERVLLTLRRFSIGIGAEFQPIVFDSEYFIGF